MHATITTARKRLRERTEATRKDLIELEKRTKKMRREIDHVDDLDRALEIVGEMLDSRHGVHFIAIPMQCAIIDAVWAIFSGRTVPGLDEPARHNMVKVKDALLKVELRGNGRITPHWVVDGTRAGKYTNPRVFGDIEGWINDNKDEIENRDISEDWMVAKIRVPGILVTTGYPVE